MGDLIIPSRFSDGQKLPLKNSGNLKNPILNSDKLIYPVRENSKLIYPNRDLVFPDKITFTTTGSSCDPTIVVSKGKVLWEFSNGVTSSDANPGTINFGSSATRNHILKISDYANITELDFRIDSITVLSIFSHFADLTNLVNFYCQINTSLTGSISSLAGLSSLVGFYCNMTGLSGSIPSLTGLTSVSMLNFQGCSFTGSIPSMTGLSSLTGLYCDNNSITGYTASTLSATLLTFNTHNNSLDVDSVNQILIDLDTAGASNGTCNVSGNTAPTGAGATAKTNLQGKNWTVTTD